MGFLLGLPGQPEPAGALLPGLESCGLAVSCALSESERKAEVCTGKLSTDRAGGRARQLEHLPATFFGICSHTHAHMITHMFIQ